MKGELKEGFDFGSFGIVCGVLFFILSIILVTFMNSSNKDDDRISDDLTWVG